MTGLRLKALLSAVSVTVLLLCALIPVNQSTADSVADDVTVPARITAAKNDTVLTEVVESVDVKKVKSIEPEQDEEWLRARFISMLNINHCYNSAMTNEESLIKCAASSLADYSQDKIGYGLCVSTYLIEGFVEDFYGMKIPAEQMYDEEAPEGYISLPKMEMETGCHSLVTMTEIENGYEVLTCLYGYSGGGEYETCLVKSRFIKNSDSQFGFNLVLCEAL